VKSALVKTLVAFACFLGMANFAYAQCSLPPANEGFLSFDEPTAPGAPVQISWYVQQIDGYHTKVNNASLWISGTLTNGRPIYYNYPSLGSAINTNGYSVYISDMPMSGIIPIILPPGTYQFELYGNFSQTGPSCSNQAPQYEEAEATYTVQ